MLDVLNNGDHMRVWDGLRGMYERRVTPVQPALAWNCRGGVSKLNVRRREEEVKGLEGLLIENKKVF